MIFEIFKSKSYHPDNVTGRYISYLGEGKFKVVESETCKSPQSVFFGKPGMGFTIREYITDGEEIPENLKTKAVNNDTVHQVKWN